MRTRLLAVVCLLAVLAALAGCSVSIGGPAPGDETNVSYTVQNADDQRVRVTLAAASEPVDGFRVTYRNNTTRRIDGDLEEVPQVSDEAVAVVPVGESVVVRDYTLTPDAGVGGRFEAAPRNTTLVASVGYPDGGAFGGVTFARCGQTADLTAVELVVEDGGDALTVSCS